nr:protein transport protein sec31-like [Aegilops tauschii subsp. strangulata]
MGSRDSPGDSSGGADPAAPTPTPPPALCLGLSGAVGAPERPPAPLLVRCPDRSAAAGRPAPPPRAVDLVPRPGIAFRACVVAAFRSGVVFDPSESPALSDPGTVWVVAPFVAGCFSCDGVSSLMSYFFCAPPERLRAAQVAPRVFSVQVASAAVARFLATVSPGLLVAVNLGVHASLAEAEADAASSRKCAARVRCLLHPPAVVASAATRRPRLKPLSIRCHIPAAPQRPSLLPLPAPLNTAPSCDWPGLDPEVADTRLDCPASSHLVALKGGTACDAGEPELSLNGCFRCLSARHYVKDCRDPVRCRRGRVSGHRASSPRCAMAPKRSNAPPPKAASFPGRTGAAPPPPPARRQSTPYPRARPSVSPGRSSPIQPRRLEVGESSSAPPPSVGESSSAPPPAAPPSPPSNHDISLTEVIRSPPPSPPGWPRSAGPRTSKSSL